jgi:hypothetical protein
MKKLFKLSIFTILILCYKSEIKCQTGKDSALVAVRTVEEAKQMAKKFNLEDSVSFKKNNILLFLPKEKAEKYLLSMSEGIKRNNEFNIFLNKTQYVKSYSDYFKLINSMPNVRKGWVDGFGSEKKYNDYIKETLKNNWRIYRTAKGELKFFRSDTKISQVELNLGKRLDTLPKY